MQNKDYEKQIEELCGKLILREKSDMIHGAGIFRTGAVERLGIPPLRMSDGPMGVRQEFMDGSWDSPGTSDDYVTYAPSNSAVASTWNPERAYAGGKILGEEARGRGKDVILAPGINIKRDPLCGRNFEYMSEDPYLTKTLAVPFIKGVQESDVAACVKHFAVNNQETDRLQVDTLVDERTLREIYLPAFKAAVQEGGSYSLMNAYNKMRGAYCSENAELLDTILRGEWQYDGAVISDWGSVHSTVGTAKVSMDVEMSVFANFHEYFLADALVKAVEDGEVAMEDVDKKVKNVLRMMYRLHMLGDEADTRKSGSYNTPEHQRATLETAREGIVLLKNEGHLPLQDRKKKIALIGVNATYQHANGGGSAEIKALYEISPIMGLKKALGGNGRVTYAPGYYVPPEHTDWRTNWQESSLDEMTSPADGAGEKIDEEIRNKRLALLEEAVALAKEADEVIFVGGLNHDFDVEGKDRRDMKLPYGQDEVIEALLAVHPELVVVMIAGSPVEMPWKDRVKSLLWCYFSGMETGTALAEILLGEVNPSGKLAETFPAVYADTATCKNGQFGKKGLVEYQEGVFVGYRYYEKEQIAPAFAFGHGLSYTTFALSGLQVQKSALPDTLERTPDGKWIATGDCIVTVTCKVQNTGKRRGAEVVQCYVGDTQCSVERPVKELRGYRKVFLAPGETKEVALTLTLDAFAFYDVAQKNFVVEPGSFVISVGTASDNCPLQAQITL